MQQALTYQSYTGFRLFGEFFTKIVNIEEILVHKASLRTDARPIIARAVSRYVEERVYPFSHYLTQELESDPVVMNALSPDILAEISLASA